MTSSLSRHLHGITRAFGWVLGIALITLAVFVAVAQVMLPTLASHPQWVAAQLSERLHRPVSFQSMSGRWTPSGPRFLMHDVSIGAVGAGETPLRIPQAELALELGGWLLPSRHIFNLRASGLELDLRRAIDGRWQISGIGTESGGTSSPMSLSNLSVGLWLDQLKIDITDDRTGRHYPLIADQLRVGLGSGKVRLGARLHRLDTTGVLTAAGVFRSDGASGRIWLAGNDLDLKAMLGDVALAGYTAEQGHGRLAAWLDWRDGKVVHSLLQADLSNVSLAGPGSGRAVVSELKGVADIRQRADGYVLRWAGDDGSALVAALHRGAGDQLQIGVAASDLQLAPLAPWLALKPGLSAALAQWLGAGRPRGELTHAALQWSRDGGLGSLTVDFKGLGIDPVGSLPGVDHLEGSLRGDAEAVSVSLPSQSATLSFPHAFRQPFALSALDATLAFWHDDDGTHIGVDPVDFTGAGYAGQARGEVLLPADGGRPFLDLYAHLDHADVAAAKLFWPIHAMSPKAVEWLDQALVSGTVDKGDILVRGGLADWPFRHNEGRFEAQASISDLTLDYGKDWPRAEHIDAVASFVGDSMLVQASQGESMGIKAQRAVALIPDFGEGLLDLNVQGSGSGDHAMQFVSNSPIASHEADMLAQLKLGGSVDFDFHLSLPLKPGPELQLTGSGHLNQADLRADAWKLKLDKLDGPLQFDAHGLRAGPLTARFRDQPSTVQMQLAGATGDPNLVLSASMDGRYSMAELTRDQPAVAWLGQVSEGRSDFRIGLDIARDSESAPWHQTITIDSTLQGIAMGLPAPLDKATDTDLPLHLSLPVPTSGADLQVSLGQMLRARLRLPGEHGEPLAGTLFLGSQMPAGIPANGLRVRGHAGRLDVTGWIQYVIAGKQSADGPSLESIDVAADQASVFGSEFSDLDLKVLPQPGELAVDADGPGLSGHFQVPTDDLIKRGITARLKRLYWPRAAPSKSAPKDASGKPLADTGPTPAEAARTGIEPASLPPMHLLVDDLRLGDAKLGEARLESWPTDKGMHIDQLRALSHSVQITASGDWNGNAEDSHTHMRIDFAAEDLGEMLSALGFDGLFNGGKTRAHLDASWPGGPSALTLANLNGKLSIDVSDGRIPEASSPGVGRLLGLVSLAELPRRLTLDFGDVFGKGLAFDTIKGDFVFADGNAITHDLKLHGPAAEITVTGRTGLRARDYDQNVLVIPHLGNSLPVVGAVVAGPVGAAAGFAVQSLLGKGLNRAASARYTITGSWDKPKMTLVEKHAVLPSPPVPPAAASSSALPVSSKPQSNPEPAASVQ